MRNCVRRICEIVLNKFEYILLCKKTILLLTSKGLNSKVGREIILNRLDKYCEKRNLEFMKVLIISNASNEVNRIIIDSLIEFGFNLELIDVVDGRNASIKRYNCYDLIYVGEAESLYELMSILDSNLKKIIKDSKENGTIYVGASAGATCISDDIKYVIQDFDNKSQEYDNIDTCGIGLVNDIMILPHYEDEHKENYIKYYEEIENINLLDEFSDIYNIPEEGYIEFIL